MNNKEKYNELADKIIQVRKRIRHFNLLEEIKNLPEKSTINNMIVERKKNVVLVDGVTACTFISEDHYEIGDIQKLALLVGV